MAKRTPTDLPQYRQSDIMGGREGAKSLDLTNPWIIQNRHRSAPAGCCLTVFDFEKAMVQPLPPPVKSVGQ
ncbi:MAG: hypothetical protein ACOYXO_16170 [Chloroflexota bacterium]